MSGLLDTVATTVAEQKAENKTRYREILLRDDPADAKALRRIMGDEGITPEQLTVDQGILRKAESLAAEAAGETPEFTAALEKACQTLREFNAETERIAVERERERQRLDIEADRKLTRRDTMRDAGRKLAELQRQHGALFGLSPEPEVKSSFSQTFNVMPDPPEDAATIRNRQPVAVDYSLLPRGPAMPASAQRQALVDQGAGLE